MKISKILLSGALFTSVLGLNAQVNYKIRLNQVGFYPDGSKIGAVECKDEALTYYLVNDKTKDTVFSGPLQDQMLYKPGNEIVRLFDFSRYNKEGKFYVAIPNIGTSPVFEIKKNVFNDLTKASLKAYYYNRCSYTLEAKYAGRFARKGGHWDNESVIHPSAASKSRPAGTKINSAGGWYDAGDYGKYIVNSGISTYTVLAAYEHYPEYYKQLDVNIPESGNKVPDILDEALFNLRWMLTMQDPEDGGVYHKLSTANFTGLDLKPENASKTRYIMQKSTTAALDFAATMGAAYRILKDFEKELPGLADSCLKAGESAFDWAKKNSDVPYIQAAINGNPDMAPKVVTGEYGDSRFDDEFFWASAELYLATKNDEKYGTEILNMQGAGLMNWSNVKMLGVISLATAANPQNDNAKDNIIDMARKMVASYKSHPYRMVMGKTAGDFVWGSNANAGNQGVILMLAYEFTGEKDFYEAAKGNLDYLLGRNGTTYSFVTGFGANSSRNIHHRPSSSDGIDDPIPGFLAGGPQPGMEDNLTYPSEHPAKVYLDDLHSYSTNEITINWNAPLLYLVGGIEASNTQLTK